MELATATKTPEIDVQIRIMDDRITGVLEQLSALEKRLNPVLIPHSEKPDYSDKLKEASQCSPLAKTLAGQNGKLSQAVSTLESLLTHLEV
jgi:hypothetical protein